MISRVAAQGCDHVLMATGRKPNTEDLGLEQVRAHTTTLGKNPTTLAEHMRHTHHIPVHIRCFQACSLHESKSDTRTRFCLSARPLRAECQEHRRVKLQDAACFS